MKKSRVIVIVLSVLLALFALYGVVATFAVREAMQNNDTLEATYGEVAERYKELVGKYEKQVYEDIESNPVILTALAHSIDDNAKISVIDDIVYMHIPYTNDVKSKVAPFVSSIETELKNKDYSSCVITVVDEIGKCVFGWTILPNGESHAFLSK